MKFKLIACKVLSRELSYLTALSENIFDITWMRQGLHDTPDRLREDLQAEVDAVESGTDPHTNAMLGREINPRTGTKEDFDAILIGYGLCSNGLAGLHSSRYPLVIPRGHDCITFFLGSRERYRKYFEALPGCFWYTAGWIENCSMPCREVNEWEMDHYREQGYDEDEIDFLREQLQGWTKNYRCAAYIKMPFFDKKQYREFTEEAADYFGWNYEEIDGDAGLLKRFISGDWNSEDFLVVPPGCRVLPSNDASIIRYEKMESSNTKQ